MCCNCDNMFSLLSEEAFPLSLFITLWVMSDIILTLSYQLFHCPPFPWADTAGLGHQSSKSTKVKWYHSIKGHTPFTVSLKSQCRKKLYLNMYLMPNCKREEKNFIYTWFKMTPGLSLRYFFYLHCILFIIAPSVFCFPYVYMSYLIILPFPC